MCTLGVFSWSLLQFTLVTTSFGDKKQDEQEKTEEVASSLYNVIIKIVRKLNFHSAWYSGVH